MPRRHTVEFYLDPETTEKELSQLTKIAKLLCQEKKGTCILPDTFYPVKMELSSEDDSTSFSRLKEDSSKSCQEGWLMVYEFTTIKRAQSFAEDMALMRPVCEVYYHSGRFKGYPLQKK